MESPVRFMNANRFVSSRPGSCSRLFPPPEDGGDICSSETTRVCERDPGRVIDGRGHDRDGLELGIEFRDVGGNRSKLLFEGETTKGGLHRPSECEAVAGDRFRAANVRSLLRGEDTF